MKRKSLVVPQCPIVRQNEMKKIEVRDYTVSPTDKSDNILSNQYVCFSHTDFLITPVSRTDKSDNILSNQYVFFLILIFNNSSKSYRQK